MLPRSHSISFLNRASKAVGTTKPGKRYLLTKALLQSSTALNLSMYLLLKVDQMTHNDDLDASAVIQSHPVMARLQKLNSLAQKLDERVEQVVPGLSEQLSNLVKAAALVNSGGLADDSDDESSNADDAEKSDNQIVDGVTERRDKDIASKLASAGDDSDDDESQDPAAEEQRVLTEARFGLRASEVNAQNGSHKRRRVVVSDFGDEDEEGVAQGASKTLASTLNTIAQRTESRNRRNAQMADEIDDAEDSGGELRAGLAMMEEEFGKDFDKEDGAGGDGDNYDAEVDDDDEFYAKVSRKSKSHKEFKRGLYAVAPKFPRVEGEIEGERAISKSILKNRGLVAHKSKLNRNPRVKKREQYRKAIIRRKGAVRQVRTDEGHKYGGEETGIKSSVSRSRKLAR